MAYVIQTRRKPFGLQGPWQDRGRHSGKGGESLAVLAAQTLAGTLGYGYAVRVLAVAGILWDSETP